MQGLDDNSYFIAMFSKACEDICTNDDFEMDLKERKPLNFKEFKDLNLADIEHYRKIPEGILYRVDDETFKVLGKFEEIQNHITNYFDTLFNYKPFIILPFSNIYINVVKIKSFNPYLVDFKSYSLPISHRLGYVNRVQYCKVIQKRKDAVKLILHRKANPHVKTVNTIKKVDKFPEVTKCMFLNTTIPTGTIAFERNLWIKFNYSASTTMTVWVSVLWQEGEYYFKRKNSNKWEKLEEHSVGSVSLPVTMGNTHIFYKEKQVIE